MAGRPPKPDNEKKQREAIYFEPDVLEWLREESKDYGNVSTFVNATMKKLMKEKERS